MPSGPDKENPLDSQWRFLVLPPVREITGCRSPLYTKTYRKLSVSSPFRPSGKREKYQEYLSAAQAALIPQFHVPVRQIKKVLPAIMRMIADGDIDKRPPLRALGLADEKHSRLMRQTISLLRITRDA